MPGLKILSLHGHEMLLYTNEAFKKVVQNILVYNMVVSVPCDLKYIQLLLT